ncbi:MAG: hypothetical protein J6N49_05925 [Alphaproteobacteria bacterium]|nr:hypothetical protein [Alphaproteobacteria bacterium]
MPRILKSLSEDQLKRKLFIDYRQKMAERNLLHPAFDNVYFVRDDQNREFLVGCCNDFNANRTYGRDEAHFQHGSSPHMACSSYTYAVLVNDEKTTDEYFEIEAYSYEAHTKDLAIGYDKVETPDGLRALVPAKTEITAAHVRDGKRTFIGTEINRFHNVADRHEILELLNSRKLKNALLYRNDELGWKDYTADNDKSVLKELENICKDFIVSTSKDGENTKDYDAAQEYQRALRVRKFSTQRKAINAAGGSTPKPRNRISKALIALRAARLSRK